jgi:hypothetical protein
MTSNNERQSDGLIRDYRQESWTLHKAIDRLGRRVCGIRNEFVFRPDAITLFEKSFGAKVESHTIGGECFDVIILNGPQILVEIIVEVGATIQQRLERNRRRYAEATGVAPIRVVLVPGWIHSKRAQALREAGSEVIELEEEELEETNELFSNRPLVVVATNI